MENLTAKSNELMEEEKKRAKELEETRKILKQMMDKGELPKARPLTRGERKQLDAAGLNIHKIDYSKTTNFSEVSENMCDWILDNIYGDFNFDAVGNHICSIFAIYVFTLSYKDSLAEKN